MEHLGERTEHALEADFERELPGVGELGGARLKTIHAVGQSLAVGPIFSAGLLTATIASVAGFSTPLSVLLAFLGALGMVYAISTYAHRFVGAGAIYEYLARGAGRNFGVFSGGLYLLGLMFIGAGMIWTGIGFLTQGFFEAHLHTHIPFWVPGIVMLFVVAGLNWFGVRTAIRWVLILATLSAVPLLFLSVVIVIKGGAGGNTLAVFGTSTVSWSGVFHGMLFGILLFIGFEQAASIAEEIEAPRRMVPVAMYATVIVSGVFFLIVCYAAAIGFGQAALGAKNAWASSPSPLGDLATQYVGNWLSVVVDLVVILDAISVSIAFMVTASRIIMALSRDGLLPRVGARTTKHNTPGVAIGFLVVWGCLLTLWAGVTTYGNKLGVPNEIEAFQIANGIGSYLIELIYIFLALFAAWYVWQTRHQSGRFLLRMIAVIVGLAATVLGFEGSLNPFPTYPLDRGVFFAIVAIVVCLLWWLYLRIRHPAAIAAAASYATDEPSTATAGR